MNLQDTMTRTKFEDLAEKVFEDLPKLFGDKIDNVHIAVEEYPSEEIIHQMHAGKTSLLGLYQGIPLTHRGTWYGTNPTTPDTISLYQANIEAVCQNDEEISERIREVLLHELGHYFGMNELEIRNAMKYFNQ
jgi:predicted Zn-dependent protease with MMP-like domain